MRHRRRGIATQHRPDPDRGLRRLEYRGYDSTRPRRAQRRRWRALAQLVSTARVADLEAQADALRSAGMTGIAHTRWATHGAPTSDNAHPHLSGRRDRASCTTASSRTTTSCATELQGAGLRVQQPDRHRSHRASGRTRTACDGDLLEAVQRAVAELRGAYAIAVFSHATSRSASSARAQGSPAGASASASDEHFLASDAMALAGVTRPVVYLEEGDVVDVQLRAYCDLSTRRAQRVERDGARRCRRTAGAVELGPYRHYMQKEIFEQPRAVADTLEGVDGDHAGAVRRRAPHASSSEVDSVLILACGTSYYSRPRRQVLARDASRGSRRTVEIASEYRYRDSVPNPNALVVVVSQSGETADTLAALKHAQVARHDAHAHDLQRRDERDGARDASCAFLTRAGAEIGVASTKAFTTQLVALFLLTLTLAQAARPPADDAGSGAPEGAAPPAGGAAGRAGARAADHRAGREAVRAQGARAVPRPRPALPDRARRRAEAQGNLATSTPRPIRRAS